MPEELNYTPEDVYKGDFEGVHNPEFQQELREARMEGEEKEFELTPEIEAKIMEKVVAIGAKRDLLAHGTQGRYLEMIQKYGLVATRPRFANRWKKFEKFVEERKSLKMSRTGEASQGEQSVSFFDPWAKIEVVEALLLEKDFYLMAVPITTEQLGLESGGYQKIKQEELILVKEEISKVLSCDIERIDNVYIPPENSLRSPVDYFKKIFHGRFRVANEDLKFYISPQNLDENIRNNIESMIVDFKSTANEQGFYLTGLERAIKKHVSKYQIKSINIGREINELANISPSQFIRIYRERVNSEEINECEKEFLIKLFDIISQGLPDKDFFEDELTRLSKDEQIISDQQYFLRGGRLLIEPTPEDLEQGRIVRNPFNLIQNTSPETAFESRVSLNRIIGITFGGEKNLEGNTEQPDINYTDALKFGESLGIPVYDQKGNLAWPRQMSYEEVKQFVWERDNTQEEPVE